MTHPHHAKPLKAKRASSNKISNNLVALSSAAVLSVYMAGYLRTSAAAGRLEESSVPRRPAAPVQVEGQQRPGPSEAPVSPENPVQEAGRGVALDSASAPVTVDSPLTASEAGGVAHQASATSATEKTASKREAAPAPADATAPATTTLPSAAPAAAEPVSAPVPVAAAPDAAVAAASPAAPAALKYKDGTYLGWGTSRHGDIQAQVVIEDGRIVSATIAQCWTRYPCSYISPLPPQVAQRQSPEIDFVSRATDSTNAFYYGLVQALNQAKVKPSDKE